MKSRIIVLIFFVTTLMVASGCATRAPQNRNPSTCIDPYFLESDISQNKERDKIRFTDTQRWDPRLLEFVSSSTKYLSGWKESLKLFPPPYNSSVRTSLELDYLAKLERKRTTKQQQSIDFEISYRPALIEPKIDSRILPVTEDFIEEVAYDANVIVYWFKNHFNRVRPSFLKDSLSPSITIPGHPAYPSGHSTRSYLWALLFSEINPEARSRYLERATEIAWHREVAGVHYPSDTIAGALLARQAADLFLQNERIQTLIKDVRSEWQRAGLIE